MWVLTLCACWLNALGTNLIRGRDNKLTSFYPVSFGKKNDCYLTSVNAVHLKTRNQHHQERLRDTTLIFFYFTMYIYI